MPLLLPCDRLITVSTTPHVATVMVRCTGIPWDATCLPALNHVFVLCSHFCPCMCQPIHVCGLLCRMPMRAMPLCLCPWLCVVFFSFSLLHILIRPLGRTFGGVRDGSSPSCGIKALLVSWLTLWRTLTRTQTHTYPGRFYNSLYIAGSSFGR